MWNSCQNGGLKWVRLTTAIGLSSTIAFIPRAALAMPLPRNLAPAASVLGSITDAPFLRSKGMVGLLIGLGLCLLAVGGIVIARKSKRRRNSTYHSRSVQAPAVANSVSNGAGSASFRPKMQTSLAGLKRSTAIAGKAANGTNGHHGPRRKKAFDYNRYFTDLMSTVSNSGFIEPVTINGDSLESDQVALPKAFEPATTSPHNLYGANVDLISSQKSLIEDQNRLIREQGRLIEEKSKLIAEKNQLLKLQSEWIEAKPL